MLFGNLNNLDFIRPIFSFAWSRNPRAMQWILKFPDNLLISFPRAGPTPGCFQNGNKGEVSGPDPVSEEALEGGMGISSDPSAARPGTGIVVWVGHRGSFCAECSARQRAAGWWLWESRPQGVLLPPAPQGVGCLLGGLSDWPSAGRRMDSNKPSLSSPAGTVNDVETPLLGSEGGGRTLCVEKPGASLPRTSEWCQQSLPPPGSLVTLKGYTLVLRGTWSLEKSGSLRKNKASHECVSSSFNLIESCCCFLMQDFSGALVGRHNCNLSMDFGETGG